MSYTYVSSWLCACIYVFLQKRYWLNLPLVLKKSPAPGEWLVKRCNPRLEQRHLEDGTSEAAPSTGPRVTRTGSPRVKRGSDGLGRSLGLVQLNAPWKIAGNWKELAKECLAMRVEPVETWLNWHFLLRNGGGNSYCSAKLSCDVFFFFRLFWCTKRAWIPGPFGHC